MVFLTYVYVRYENCMNYTVPIIKAKFDTLRNFCKKRPQWRLRFLLGNVLEMLLITTTALVLL